MLLHRRDRREGLACRRRHADDPACRADDTVGDQHFLAKRIDQYGSPLVARQEAVDQRINPRPGQLFHDPALVGGHDDLPLIPINEQETAGFAERRRHRLGHEIAQAEFDLADDDAEHTPMLVADWRRHRERGGIKAIAEIGLADRGMAPADGLLDQHGIAQVGAGPCVADRVAGHRQRVRVVNHQAAIKQRMQQWARLDMSLHRRLATPHRLIGAERDPLQRIETAGDGVLHLLGEQRRQGILLVAQQARHVPLEKAADEQGQRPAADQENADRDERDTRLQRMAVDQNTCPLPS